MIDQLDIEFEADRTRDIARLIPIAKDLAARATVHGITVANLRLAAVNAGVLTGSETGRRLSFLGVVMKKAGLSATPEFRRSHIDQSHGNLHRVFVAPEFSRRSA